MPPRPDTDHDFLGVIRYNVERFDGETARTRDRTLAAPSTLDNTKRALSIDPTLSVARARLDALRGASAGAAGKEDDANAR